MGPIQEPPAFVILKQLESHLIRKDPLATELLLDQMIRLGQHGRTGQILCGISSVDCGPLGPEGEGAWIARRTSPRGTHSIRGPACASTLGFSIEPDVAAGVAKEYQAEGFTAQKWFFRHCPADGKEGITKNLGVADAVGDNYELMFDAFNGWTLSCATEMVRALEPLVPTWMEEPIPPERVSEFCKLRDAARVPIATGEHVYTRWQVKELLVNQAIDVLQTEPD